MNSIDRKKIGILLICSALIILVGTIVMNIIPSSEEQIIEKNVELREEQMINLLKSAQKNLKCSASLQSNHFSDDEMVKFAISYMEIANKYTSSLTYDESNETIIVDITHLPEMIEYIFGVKVTDFSDLGYKLENNKLYVRSNFQGGDAQIYKYKETQYDEQQDVYVAYIDCLEVNGAMYQEVLKSEYIEYDMASVIGTMVFKYRVVGNRKILLAYNCVSTLTPIQ